jgi:iron(III) transport system permease protein
MANTLLVGVGTVIVMILFTVPMAWIYTRTDLPRKNILLGMVTINVAVPSFLVAMGYIYIFNPNNGIRNEILRAIVVSRTTPFNVYTLGWVILLQGVALSAPAFFMMVPTFQGIDSTLEEAAVTNGVIRWAAAFYIVLPLASPAILAVSAYYFIIAVEMFDYAGMLATPARTYVAATLLYLFIHDGSGLPRYAQGASLGLIMAGLAMVLAIIYLYCVRNADRYVVLTGKRKMQMSIKLSQAGRRGCWGFVVAVPSIVGALGFLFFGLTVNSYIAIYGTIWLIAIAMTARYIT